MSAEFHAKMLAMKDRIKPYLKSESEGPLLRELKKCIDAVEAGVIRAPMGAWMSLVYQAIDRVDEIKVKGQQDVRDSTTVKSVVTSLIEGFAFWVRDQETPVADVLDLMTMVTELVALNSYTDRETAVADIAAKIEDGCTLKSYIQLKIDEATKAKETLDAADAVLKSDDEEKSEPTSTEPASRRPAKRSRTRYGFSWINYSEEEMKLPPVIGCDEASDEPATKRAKTEN